MKNLCAISCILLIIGGLNWGLFGLFDINLVEVIFGRLPYAAKAVYALVGLAAIYEIFTWKK